MNAKLLISVVAAALVLCSCHHHHGPRPQGHYHNAPHISSHDNGQRAHKPKAHKKGGKHAPNPRARRPRQAHH